MKETSYHAAWQKNRIKFILSKYSEDFFKGKNILELGPHNGYIGASFANLGANVHCIEGRLGNVENIKNNYPMLSVKQGNCDTPNWEWGQWDIIINFGLYYHLEEYHKEHLSNCIKNCDLMFFETVIYDSDESTIYFRDENGNDYDTADQSLTKLGGTPSTSYVENIFKEHDVKYTKFSDGSLNGSGHNYDWKDTGNNTYNSHRRRFWIIEK